MRKALLLLMLSFVSTEVMAATVTQTGSTIGFTVTSTDNATQSITAPSDAQFMAVLVAGYTGDATASLFCNGTMTYNGVAMAKTECDDVSTALEQSAIFTLASPATGANSLHFDWAGSSSPLIGVQFFVIFLKGNNLTSPIRSHGGQAVTGNATATTTSLNAASGDYVVAISHSSNTGAAATAYTWTNATSASFVTTNSGTAQYGYANGNPTGSVTISAQQTGGSATFFTNLSAVIVASAGAGSGGGLGTFAFATRPFADTQDINNYPVGGPANKVYGTMQFGGGGSGKSTAPDGAPANPGTTSSFSIILNGEDDEDE